MTISLFVTHNLFVFLDHDKVMCSYLIEAMFLIKL